MRAAASEVSGKHVGKGVEAVDRVWREGGKPFKESAFVGCRKGFAKNGIMGSVEGDVRDVDLEVFIGVDFTSVTLQLEGFLLGGEGGCWR